MAAKSTWDCLPRRQFIQRAGMVGAGTVLPLLNNAAVDPDRLFKYGRFKAAEREYRRQLRRDPDNAHAAAQIGYIALLSNRFGYAETYLTRAVSLVPDDVFSVRQLADCYVRQDLYDRAVPVLRSTGEKNDEALAELYDAIPGSPWQIRGPRGTRTPLLGLEPLPHLEVSVNGTAPQKFVFDTGGETVDMSTELARKAGLRAVSTTTGRVGGANGQEITRYHGIAESVRIGNIEVRNIPVSWNDTERLALPHGTRSQGVIGTTCIYHFLATVDYANRQFVLRRRTEASLALFRVETRHDKVEALPLWLAKGHFPVTLGSVNDYGPRLVTLDTGGINRGIDVSFATAERAGVQVGWDHPIDAGHGVYPITPERMSLGKAIRRHVKGTAEVNPGVDDGMGFDTIANFTHYYFFPFAITPDFVRMILYVSGNSIDPDAN